MTCTSTGTAAVRVDDDAAVELGAADGPRHDLAGLARYLAEGSELVTRIEGVGELRNTLVTSA